MPVPMSVPRPSPVGAAQPSPERSTILLVTILAWLRPEHLAVVHPAAIRRLSPGGRVRVRVGYIVWYSDSITVGFKVEIS